MNRIRNFRCGMCKKKGITPCFTRKGLREHLKEEHRIMTALTNSFFDAKRTKQDWWIAEETE